MTKTEALTKRKIHFLIKDYTSGIHVYAPLCGLSPEVPRYGVLKYTANRNAPTCKRCIRSIYGSYTR